MRSLVDDGLFDSGKTVENNGAAAAFDVVDGGLGEGEADGDGDGVTVYGTEGAGHGDGWRTLRVRVELRSQR